MAFSIHLRVCRVVLGILSAAIFGSAGAFHPEDATRYVQFFCVDDWLKLENVPPIHIPVGCETIDCCPGCPAAWSEIDWHVYFSGLPGQQVALRFENLSAAEAKNLEIEGSAKWLDGFTLGVRAGRATIRGLPRRWKGPLPVVHATPIVDVTSLDSLRETVRDTKTSRVVGNAEFVIEQLLGDVLVNRVISSYRFVWCNWPLITDPENDKIKLTNNTSNDSAVIRFVARRSSGCEDQNIYRTTGTVSVGSVLSNGGCSAETFVFSDDNAMAWVNPSTSWTDGPGDVQTIWLVPLLQNPVTVWVLKQPVSPRTVDMDVQRARALYNSMNCGLDLAPVAIKDVTNNPLTPGLINADCSDAIGLRSIGFTLGQLNVYYVDDIGSWGSLIRGHWCDNNMVLVSATYSDNESLAHELGHAFSLVDSNPDIEISTTNLMHSGGTGRDNITTGQCFRCNVNTLSMVNKNGVRPTPPLSRFCPDFDARLPPIFCPELSWDEIPR